MEDKAFNVAKAVGSSAQAGANRAQQNLILLSTNNSGLLTSSSNVTNLLATHPNNIASKSKIMILAPVSGASGNATTSATALSGSTTLPANLVHQVIRSSGSAQTTTIQQINSGNFNLKSQTIQVVGTQSSPSKIAQTSGSNQISRATISYPISSLAPTNFTSTRSCHEYNSNINLSSVAVYSSINDDKTNGHNSVSVQNRATEIDGVSNSIKQKINSDLECEYDGLDLMAVRVKQEESLYHNAEMDGTNELKAFSDSNNAINYDPKIFSDETLDRSSPELWPEAVPGVVKFIANTSPNIEFEEDEGEQTNENPDEQFIAGFKTEEVEDDESIRLINSNQTFSKMVKSFAMTPYGLESTNFLPISVLNDSRECSSLQESRCNSPASSESSCSAVSTSNKTGSVSSTKPTANVSQMTTKDANVPAWQRDLDEDEIAMVYGYGSLTPSSLMDKIKEIQNLAYQLGLEEEREMMRARYLNILNQPNQSTDCYPKVALEPELDSLISREFVPEVSGSQSLV